MAYDKDKAAEMALALMYLNTWTEKGAGPRAWKSFPWELTDHLFEKGYISDPKGKAKSVWLTEEGAKLSEELFRKHFGVEGLK